MTPLEIAPRLLSEFITRPIPRPSTSLAATWRDLDASARLAVFERALDSLWLAYQPIVALSAVGETGAPLTIGYEALARNHEALVPEAHDLLALAVSCGRVRQLGEVVHLRVAESLAAHPDTTFFVNVDVEELCGPSTLREGPLAAFRSRVVLEVTERAPVSDKPEVRAGLGELREEGFRFAMDDLGGGYSGLSMLPVMAPEYIKVDQTLVRGIHGDPVKKKIVGALASLARQLGIGCIVEGVEAEPERDALVSLGCDLMQGFLFGRPGPLGGA